LIIAAGDKTSISGRSSTGLARDLRFDDAPEELDFLIFFPGYMYKKNKK
jgi:hypothetical protein